MSVTWCRALTLGFACRAVRVATWIKRNFALKPALAQARKDRAEFRTGPLSSQADDMY